MKEENIRKIGIAKKVKNIELFVAFLSERFPNESDEITSYFSEWAGRFNSGYPERYMDKVSLEIFNKLVYKYKT